MRRFLLNIVMTLFLLLYITIIFPPIAMGLDDSVDFGQGYRYIIGYPQAITCGYKTVSQVRAIYQGSYYYDENYIVFVGNKLDDESLYNRYNKVVTYIIIDKKRYISFEYDDEDLFYNKLNSINIKWNFKNEKSAIEHF